MASLAFTLSTAVASCIRTKLFETSNRMYSLKGGVITSASTHETRMMCALDIGVIGRLSEFINSTGAVADLNTTMNTCIHLLDQMQTTL